MANFKHASIYRQVVEFGSMAEAAKALAVTPSVISKKIAELESSLGVQLLIRTTRKLEVTEAGEYFYQTFCRIDSEWNELLSEVARLNDKPAGVLTIAAPTLVNSRVLMKDLARFTEQYPDIEFDLRSVDYDAIPASFADISLARDIELFNSSMFVRVPLYRYVNQLFASPAYLEKHGVPDSIEALSQHSCLAYGKQVTRTRWEFAGGEQVQVQPKLWSDNTEILIQAALQGRGIIYVPALILTKELENNLLVPVDVTNTQSREFEFVAYYRKQQYLPRKCRVLLDFLKTCGPELPQ
ncbi:LysR family transcriptional regulator [Vibrio sp. SCSIO 43132]|uniref:LysR family transcriptional regulator n=1 Tax=Vibrio sp. SCSIO 43132 TaxID=2779363 RepID=UPI001CA92A6F|nr:LysR family transcriptional regulator [Vibrio sp. SCSIO 43132]UAB70162.1 LysR family transcriptional regulator [Vibrio sp. SCSIO 43132]